MAKEETEIILNEGGTVKCRILGARKKVAYFQVILPVITSGHTHITMIS
jgi:hypothetical protein